MNATTALPNVLRALAQWREALETLHFTVAEDRPGDLAVADLCEAAVSDLIGWLDDAAECGRQAETARQRNDEQTALTATASCYRHVMNATLHQAEQLLASERQRQMAELARRSHSWVAWLQMVRISSDTLPRHAHAVHEALLLAWEAAAADRGSVHIFNSVTGQQFAGPAERRVPEPASIV